MFNQPRAIQGLIEQVLEVDYSQLQSVHLQSHFPSENLQIHFRANSWTIPSNNSTMDCACFTLVVSNKSTPNQARTAQLSGPPIPGVHNSEPGNRFLITWMALTSCPGLFAVVMHRSELQRVA